MNRAERRKMPPAIRAIADNLHTIRCPDCHNETRLVESDGVYVLRISHDHTCPWLKRYEERRHA
jgi:hypothetical protein